MGFGLGGGGGIYYSIASCSFGGTFVETIFLDEGFPSFFVFHFSVLFQLIVRCIVLLLHRFPRFFLVSPSIPFFRFHLALPYEQNRTT